MSAQKHIIPLIGILAIALLLWSSPVAADDWDKSSITLEGQCQADGTAEFVVTNTGAGMAGPSAWREFETDVLTADGTFQLAAGAAQTWIFGPLPGVQIRFEADQRPGHPGSSAPNLTLTCQRPTAVTLTTFAASSTQLLSAVCQRGVVTDFLPAPGGHVVFVVREGHSLSDSYWTTRHFSITQRVMVCAGIVK